MKSIQIREITTTGKASVIVINPYLVRNLLLSLIKVQDLRHFLSDSLRHDQETDNPIFVEGESTWVPNRFLEDVYNEVYNFLNELDHAVIEGEQD